MRAAATAVVALLGGGALAQEAPSYAPCLAVHPQPADYVAAFEAEGWTFVEGGAAREEALGGLTFATMLVTMLPTRPATKAELADLLALAESSRQARRFDVALIFTRGDAAAALEFDARADGMAMICTFAASDLPDVEAPLGQSMQVGDRPVAVEAAAIEASAPAGARSLRVDTWRFLSDVAPVGPIPGAEALSVMLVRTEPRQLVPQIHGLLRAFGPEEMGEALRAAGEGGE